MRETYKDYFSDYIHHVDRNNNMGLMRYILAFGVLIAHFNYICGANVPWVISSHNRVGGFFAMSGFVLVCSVLKGCSFKDFAIRRLWRIMPSYIFVILVVALSFAFFSLLSPLEYYTHPGFWKYLAANLPFLNFLSPSLPEVFNNSPVNGSLWTMKVEMQLSLSLPLLIWVIRRYNLSITKTLIFIIIASLAYRVYLNYMYETTQRDIYEIMGRQFVGQCLFFCLGILIFCHYDRFCRVRTSVIIISGIIYFAAWFLDYTPLYHLYIQPFVISFLVLGLSLIPHDFGALLDRGHNISYELFLCHHPVMKILEHENAVERWGVGASLALAIVGTLAFAIITYVLVGRLYTKRRKARPSAQDGGDATKGGDKAVDLFASVVSGK